MAYRIAELIVLHVLGIYLCLYTSLWIVGLVMLGVAEGRCGWLMHEAGHRSMTGVISIDNVLQNLIFGLGDGMSAGWWRVQHNKHHVCPQKLDHDIDLDTLPLVAFNKLIAHQTKGMARFWVSLQAFMFGPVTCSLVVLSWQCILHPRYVLRTRHWDEALTISVRWLLLYYIYTIAGVAPVPFVLAYFFSQGVGATSIFVNFALSHSHLPVVKPNEHRHWVEYGAFHTIDIYPHPVTDWWMGFLNYQIEHHLFPEMPQYKFKKLWPQTKAFFESHQLPYDVRGYFQAMRDTFRNLAEVAGSL
jgi:fatty acid desaturase